MSCENTLLERELGSKKHTFLVSVAILEGRHYTWPNMDSVVTIQVFGKKEKTAIVRHSDCPYYNEYFTFEKKATLNKILDSDITITVIQPRSVFKKRKILGFFKLDVATVWAEPDHQFFNKWAILSAPMKKYVSGSRGFLKVNIALITNNISPTLPKTQDDNEISGNLLLPHSKMISRFVAKFEFDIYRAENLYVNKKTPASSHVQVSFAGMKAETALRRNTSSPVFNEKLIIQDLFPPLCQRFHLNIFCGSTLYASDILTLKSLTSDTHDDFLPSFGPSFLHFYDEKNMEEYKTSLLFSLSTKLEIQSMSDKIKMNNVGLASLHEKSIPHVMLNFFCIIFECSALDKRFTGKSTLKLTIGNEDTKLRGNSNVSEMIEVVKINKHSNFMRIKDKKPFLTHSLVLFDCRKKLYNFNILRKLMKNMEKKLWYIGSLFEKDDITLVQEISEKLSESIEFFQSSAKKYLDIANNYKGPGMTALESAKLENCSKTIDEALRKTNGLFNPKALRRTFLKFKKLYDRLLCLSENENDTWPDVFITVWKENRKLAYVRLPCEKILFSQIEEETGELCGRKTTLYFQSERKKIPKAKDITNMVGKMEVLLWLGVEKYVNEFLKNLPKGFEKTIDSETELTHLVGKEAHDFQCRCHLFQGRIKPGNDPSALSDTIVRVHFGDDCQESLIEKETLNPTWNQSLIFTRITLYGDISFIKSNPPSIIIELLDRDSYFFWDYIGRNSVKPLIKSREEPYAPPTFPPKLDWIRIFNDDEITAEILAAFELLEITGDVEEDNNGAERDIIRIPADILPALSNFRMEILFWGVRNLRKVDLLSISNPQIFVVCGNAEIHSDVIQGVKNSANFGDAIKIVELELPKRLENAAPLTIKLIDNRKCGIHTFAGVYIKHLKNFFVTVVTAKEREKILTGQIQYEFPSIESDDENTNSETKLTEKRPAMSFAPQHCFCRTSQAKKLKKKISKIRCTCTKTHWQKFRQIFNKKRIICPCLKEYKSEVEKIEKKNRKTCACCRKILEKLRFVTSDAENKPTIWDVFKKSMSGKCACCQKIAEKIKKICHETDSKCAFCKRILRKMFGKKVEEEDEEFDDDYNNEDYDWWTKYFASLEPEPKPNERVSIKHKYRLRIYQRELESLSEFQHFADILMSFPLFKGRRTGDEILDKEMETGIFKGAIKIYKWPPETGHEIVTRSGFPIDEGFFKHVASNIPQQFMLRVYCVRALNLPAKDVNGKCDPYLLLRLNDKEFKDKANYKTRDQNPLFGTMFEFHGYLPKDHTLTIQVWDRDLASRDDLIGETFIDVENRLYTQHRANCGLPGNYEEDGYCAWRDQMKPSNILSQLCISSNLPKPEYGLTSVKVCSKIFECPRYESSGNDEKDREIKALYALRNWHEIPYVGCRLVPEHVETRSLYNPKKALIEQGKLQLWIEIFASSDLPPPNPVDISIKPPTAYELRVIIWDTDDVLLQEDDFFTGQKKSDIFVRGALLGHDNEQSTDVHYRSLNGEGNFNWRFIFPMKYLCNEEKTLVRKKEGIFESKESDLKFPCNLVIQVWENDTFSKDDFLGTLTLNLSNMPRGAKSKDKCTLEIVEPNVPHINLFRKKKFRGWWPFKGKDLDDNLTIVGKVDVELELLTSEEAHDNPAGLGRTGPQALPEPKRPSSSFSWFLSPWKAVKFGIWKNHRGKIICIFCLLFFILFLGLAIYAFPGYTVKKLLGA